MAMALQHLEMHLFLIRSRKFRERIEASIQAAQRASKYALQKADIAISRTATARSKAEFADEAADKARVDCEGAVATAREFAPDFKPSVLERFERLRFRERVRAQPSDDPVLPTMKQGQKNSSGNQIMGNNLDTSALNRKPSMIPPSTFDNPQVPSTMYSQQVSPRTDLTQHINKIQQHEQQRYQTRSHQINSPSTYQHQNQPQQISSTLAQAQNTVTNEPTNFSNPSNINLSQQQSTQKFSQKSNTNQSYDSNYNSRNQTYLDYGGMTDTSFNAANQQQSQLINSDKTQNSLSGSRTNLRRNSRPVNQTNKPMLGEIGTQSSIDHFDHYKRPPSRDNSVDRYTRAASRLSGQSRPPSVDRNIAVAPIINNTTSSDDTTPNRNVRASSQFRGSTPAPQISTGNGSVPTGNSFTMSSIITQTSTPKPTYSSPNQPFEDVLLRQRTLGQDIIPSPSQPKRTESLFVTQKVTSPSSGGAGGIAGKIKLKIQLYPSGNAEHHT
ncbi:GATA zinc finger domain-containing protein 14-like [Condylostylus longicornis]|uniref:GATA zinc finger domain-containing protein 14-like n=1 Tax=Condylostylus longicornis TaxID=2530218 RepID=UPI00244E2CA5|nr:GATA zinc finger domain-containing protein 14-like [Condylostylus longicornis]